jgi:hypothetical protein
MVIHPPFTSSSNVLCVPEAETPSLVFQWLSRSRKQLPAFFCDTQRPETMVYFLFIKSPFLLLRNWGQKQMPALFCEAEVPNYMVDFLMPETDASLILWGTSARNYGWPPVFEVPVPSVTQQIPEEGASLHPVEIWPVTKKRQKIVTSLPKWHPVMPQEPKRVWSL